jgi:hypothetical protein
MVPASDGGDDFVGVIGPSEGVRVGVGLDEEAIDGRLQGDEGVKHTRFRRCLVNSAKKPSAALIQDAEVGVKWKMKRGCRASHLSTLGTSAPMVLRKRMNS